MSLLSDARTSIERSGIGRIQLQEPNTTQPAEGVDKFDGICSLLNFALVFCLVWFLWYLFMHPNGLMKKQIGMHGCSLMVICLCTIVFMSKVADFFFIPHRTGQSSSFVNSSAMFSVACFIVGLFSINTIFWGLLAALGVTCWDHQFWRESENTQVPYLIGDENGLCAIIYFATALFSSWSVITTKTRTMKWLRLAALPVFSLIIPFAFFHQDVTLHTSAFLKGRIYRVMELGAFVILAGFLLRTYVRGLLNSVKERGGWAARFCLTAAGGLAMYGGYVLIENLLLGTDTAKLRGAPFVWSMIFLCITLLQLDFYDREKAGDL